MSHRPHLVAEMAADPDDPRHGTNTGYGYGCRCEKCVVSERARMMQVRRKAGIPPRNVLAHGSPSMYRYGCRCDECRIAVAAYARHLRRQKAYRHWKEKASA